MYECDQAIAWLRSLIGGAAAGAAAPAKQLEAEPEKGMKLLKKKEDEDMGGLFSGLGGKKGKGAKREAARAAAAGGEAKGDKVRSGARGGSGAGRGGCGTAGGRAAPASARPAACVRRLVAACVCLLVQRRPYRPPDTPPLRPPLPPPPWRAQKLKLLMDDLKLLLKLGITKPPTTVGEVPPIIETLEGKKKDLEDKRDKVGRMGGVG